MSFELSIDEGKFLINLARNTVKEYLENGKTLKPPKDTPKKMFELCGVFVTINSIKNGEKELRGCIGYVSPIKPLYLVVRDVARFAALEDSRFRPVGAAELPSLVYEISVLSPMRRVLDTKEIVIGRHGLLLREGGNEGVFLPQVPVEEKWDRATYLEELCGKAGLPPHSWQNPAADLFRFTAVVFGEGKGV